MSEFKQSGKNIGFGCTLANGGDYTGSLDDPIQTDGAAWLAYPVDGAENKKTGGKAQIACICFEVAAAGEVQLAVDGPLGWFWLSTISNGPPWPLAEDVAYASGLKRLAALSAGKWWLNCMADGAGKDIRYEVSVTGAETIP